MKVYLLVCGTSRRIFKSADDAVRELCHLAPASAKLASNAIIKAMLHEEREYVAYDAVQGYLEYSIEKIDVE